MLDSFHIDVGTNFRVNDPDLIVDSSRCIFREGFPVQDVVLWNDPVTGTVIG